MVCRNRKLGAMRTPDIILTCYTVKTYDVSCGTECWPGKRLGRGAKQKFFQTACKPPEALAVGQSWPIELVDQEVDGQLQGPINKLIRKLTIFGVDLLDERPVATVAKDVA